MRYSVLVAVFLAAGCPRSKSAPTMTAHEESPAEVVSAAKATIEAWRQAYEVKSLDALSKLYAHEADAVMILDGQPLRGWDSMEFMLKDKIGRAKEIHVRLKDIAVRSLAPTIASAVATMTREVGDGVTTVTEAGALTLVLRKDPDGWKIVVEHYSYRRP
jgi:ketosteroid isomerase-like protein